MFGAKNNSKCRSFKLPTDIGIISSIYFTLKNGLHKYFILINLVGKIILHQERWIEHSQRYHIFLGWIQTFEPGNRLS